MQIKTFCAANSGDGFISFFDTITDEKNQRVFYIKGGPGSGKSTLLNRIASMSENAELIYCSGDPASLDAVLLPDQNAVVLDATYPHSFEPKYPAVCGNIIDLGQGWNPKKMNRDLILNLFEEKAAVYKKTHGLLKSAKSIVNAVFSPLCLEDEKIRKYGDRLLKQYALWEPKNQFPVVKKRFLSAISPGGKITETDPILKLCDYIIILEDRWLLAHKFLSHLDQKLTENNYDHINSYHPLMGKDTLHHIIVPEAKLAIVSKDGLFPVPLAEESITKKIVLQNFMDTSFLEENKNKLSFFKRLIRELINTSCESLNQAKEIHMKIESEYAKGTDFEEAEPLKLKLINNIFIG